MSVLNKQFTTDELTRIDKADDLKISPFRADGVTYGTPTWVWEVVVDGDLYVRAYSGIASRWHKAALKQKAGRIKAADMVKAVSFEPVYDRNIDHRIDEAYKKKYKGSPYLADMISSRAQSATVRILPQDS
ncbi:MAG: hypothetical protein JWR38_2871 [Mucilaginibacter sp.]|nr:hypothetical protein [Mucilaginibacter sp.]